MASSAYAPYTQAERRSVPSRVNPTLVAAASIGVLSVRVSICRRCSPFTANPYSQSVCRTSTPNPRPWNAVAGRSRCEPSGCVCRCARAGPRRPVPATPVRQRRSTLPGPKVRSRRRANDPNLAGWAATGESRRVTAWAHRRTARSGELGRRSRDGHAARSFRHVSRAHCYSRGTGRSTEFPRLAKPGTTENIQTGRGDVAGSRRPQYWNRRSALGDSQHTPATPMERGDSSTILTLRPDLRYKSKLATPSVAHPTLPIGGSDNGRRPSRQRRVKTDDARGSIFDRR